MLNHTNEANACGVCWALVVAALAVGCSSSPTMNGTPSGAASGSSSGGTGATGSSSSGGASGVDASGGACTEDAGVSAVGATTWTDGTSQAATFTIPAGSTVIVAPGASIAMAANASIVVSGTLVVSSACGAHATLAWPSGATSAAGIIVSKGGTVRLDGVDLSGAGVALSLLGGSTAEYDHGTIDSAAAPFNLGPGATLTTNGATVTNTRGPSSISGSLVATNLDYDSNGNSGIVGVDSATIDIRNSKLHGSGPVTDMLISSGSVGATIHVQNTEIYQVHCAFHFDPVNTFDISYTNMHDNAFGFMLYGSGSAGGTMTYSNIGPTNQVSFAPAGINGPITFDHSYIPASPVTSSVTITNAASSPIAGAGPM